MPLCTRPGCGADFSDPGPCTHHAGAPVFHEGLKSWSCCAETNKPVLEFDQFLALPPCATEPQHSDVKRKKEETKPAAAKEEPAKPAQQKDTAAPLSGAALASAQALAAPRSKAAAPPKPAEPKPEEQDPLDADATLAQGAACKRSGCKATFEGGKRDREKEECNYHKGVAVFHEGSKVSLCTRQDEGGAPSQLSFIAEPSLVSAH